MKKEQDNTFTPQLLNYGAIPSPLLAITVDIDGQALFSPLSYKKIFDNVKKKQKQHKQRLSIVKITNKEGGRTIHRAYKAMSLVGLTKDVVMLSHAAMQELKLTDDDKVSVEPGCWFFDYLNHPNASTRISFRLGGLGLLMGITSIVITVVGCAWC